MPLFKSVFQPLTHPEIQLLQLQYRIAISFFLAFIAHTALGEDNVKTFDDYEIHYSVFNTSFLAPQIANTYNIVRSKSKALMNIAILQKQADGSRKNVTAVMSGEQYDLIRKEPLVFQEVREEKAIYYLSSFDFQHKTTLYFTLFIQPDPGKPAYKVQFNKMLYRDE